jgi:hypothetical protein
MLYNLITEIMNWSAGDFIYNHFLAAVGILFFGVPLTGWYLVKLLGALNPLQVKRGTDSDLPVL